MKIAKARALMSAPLADATPRGIHTLDSLINGDQSGRKRGIHSVFSNAIRSSPCRCITETDAIRPHRREQRTSVIEARGGKLRHARTP